ncbi:MAG: C2 domain-containing protein [Candidatus Nanohaloarchaea archaeon]
MPPRDRLLRCQDSAVGRRAQISLGVLVTLVVVLLVAGFAVTSFQGILNPAKQKAAEQTDEIPQRDEDSSGGVDSTNIQASNEFVVCPSSCEAVINTDDGTQQFSASGTYRLPFPSLHSGETTTVNSVSNLPAGCAAWLHKDIRGMDQAKWYSQDPSGSLKVESGQELESHDAEFVVIAPEEPSCRSSISNIRYVVKAERNDDAIGGGTFHVHTTFSAMHDSDREYRITLQNRNCDVEKDTGWQSFSGNAWWWKGWKVGDPDGAGLHKPFQINIWNRDYSETEPQFSYVGCEPDSCQIPSGSLGYGERRCSPGGSGVPDQEPTISNVDYNTHSGNEIDLTAAVQNNAEHPIRVMVKFEQNDGDVYGNCPGGAGCPVKQIEGGEAAVFEHTTNWKASYARGAFSPDFDVSIWVENSEGTFERVTRQNYECCSGSDTGGGTQTWDFTMDSAEIRSNGHKDATTRSDPKAKVTLADGSHAETGKIDDAQSPQWDNTLFTGKSQGALSAVTLDIDDYDHASWDDDVGECDFNIDASNFESGTEFTLTKSCGTVFDATFTISPSG